MQGKHKKIIGVLILISSLTLNYLLFPVYQSNLELNLASKFPPQLVWEKTWHRNLADYGQAITGDQNHLYTVGHTEQGGKFDLTIMKWNRESGELVWVNYIVEECSIDGNDLFLLDSAIYTVGTIKSVNKALVVAKWDSNSGQMLWKKIFNTTSDDTGLSIWGNGDYIYTGGKSGLDCILIKWDCKNGNEVWYNKIGESQLIDDGMSLASYGSDLYCLISNTTDHGIHVIKLNTNSGEKEWSSEISKNGSASLKSLFITSDSLFAAAQNDEYGLLIKWDRKSGKLLSQRTWEIDSKSSSFVHRGIHGSSTKIFTTGDLGASTCVIIEWSQNTGEMLSEMTWSNYFASKGRSIWYMNNSIYISGYVYPMEFGKSDDILIMRWDITSNIVSHEYAQTLVYSIGSVIVLTFILMCSMFYFRAHPTKKMINSKITKQEQKSKQKAGIRKEILRMGTQFNRLQIKEIMERCHEKKYLIISTIKEMIANKEIYAEYFKSTQTLAFDQQANIRDIDMLMGTIDNQFQEWEQKEVLKEGKT